MLRRGRKRAAQKEVHDLRVHARARQRLERVAAMEERADRAVDLRYRGCTGESVGEAGVVHADARVGELFAVHCPRRVQRDGAAVHRDGAGARFLVRCEVEGGGRRQGCAHRVRAEGHGEGHRRLGSGTAEPTMAMLEVIKR